jgi:PAS domain S-box-containing protein
MMDADSRALHAEIVYLRDADRQWHALFDSLRTAVWLMDTEMRVLYANRGTRSLFGVAPDAIVGRRCWEIVHGTSAAVCECPVLRAIETGESESTVLRVGERTLEITGSPVRDDGGRLTGLVHVVDDITARVVAQEAQRRGEENFRRMLADTETGFVVIDERGVVREANAPYARMAGAGDPGELIGRSVLEWTAPDQVGANAEAVALCARQGFIRDFETVHLRKDGTRAHIVISSNSREVRGENLLFSYCKDITAREHAAAETRALLKATRAIVEELEFPKVARRVFDICRGVVGAADGLVSLRSADGQRDEVICVEPVGRPGPADAALSLSIRGLRGEAYDTGRAVFDNDFGKSKAYALVPPGHVVLHNVLFAPMRSGRVTVGMMGLANKPGGFDDKDARIAEAFGELLAVALMRSKAAERLAESDARYRLIAENVSDVIWTADLDLRVTYISPSHERMSGYSVEESMNARADSLLTASSAKLVAAVLEEEMAIEGSGRGDPKRTRRMEIEQANKDGSAIWVEVQASFLRDEQGRPVGIMGVSRDITEKRRMLASLSQADRLANMGMLAAGVAHEINNPLSYVLYNLESLALDLPGIADEMSRCRAGLAERFGEEAVDDVLRVHASSLRPELVADRRERLREALSGGDRIKAIVRGLGTFSRVEKTEVSPVDVREPVEHAVNMARNEIRYRARLVTDLGITPPVMASDGKLAQVVLNLLVNAAQSIGEGDVAHNEIRVRTWTEGGGVFIEVGDTGAGIPDENMGRIFEPFFTTKPVGVGSGLGLSICRKIVEDFGGEIGVASEVGIGTRFTIRLPATADDLEDDVAEADKASPSPPEVRGRILVVDDEPGIRNAITRILGRKHEIVTAASGEEAQKILGEDQAFDLLFFDVMMPSITGIDLHAWLTPRNPSLAARVVFFTGGTFTPRANEYLSRVGNRRFEKPFDVAKLLKSVAELVREAKGGAK